MEEMSFEPFYDYESITEEMIEDLHKVVVGYKVAARRFEAMRSKREAISVLKTQLEVQEAYNAIMSALWTVPAMIHVAGAPRTETHPRTGTEAVAQRCQRCGSMLQLWHENLIVMGEEGPTEVEQENVSWWDEGQIVAKAIQPGGMHMYQIDDRELHHYEHECVDIKGIVGTIFDEE